MLQKNDSKTIGAWTMYDWANSAFSLVITSTIFPIYYTDIAGSAVSFFGYSLDSSALFSFSISFSFLFIAIINPLLTAIADFSGRKKQFMQFFCYLGAFSCIMLAFFVKETFWLGIIAFIFGLIGFSGSLVFYNSYLPEIASEDRMDSVSARGYSMGYIGSVILLVFNLALILNSDKLGTDKGILTRISFALTGIWWAGFAQITFAKLPKTSQKTTTKSNTNWILNGFNELKKVFGELKHRPTLKKFLLAFFLYNTGVQTVLFVATIFGKDELKLSSSSLITTILLLQIVAILGAYLFSLLSKKIGNIGALTICCTIWIGVCVGAYFTQTENQFYLLAAVVGSIMGGVQSLSRSTYAKFIPQNTHDTASYFSFYDFSDKVSTVLGTLAFGLIDAITGSMRYSVLALMVFFILGVIFLMLVPKKEYQK
jgi:MFS transporter, UMF1 family